MQSANTERCAQQMKATFGIEPEEVLCISAKTGLGVGEVLETIIERVPPPEGSITKPLKCLLFDSSCVYTYSATHRPNTPLAMTSTVELYRS
jgi:translation elongation factor EF-4